MADVALTSANDIRIESDGAADTESINIVLKIQQSGMQHEIKLSPSTSVSQLKHLLQAEVDLKDSESLSIPQLDNACNGQKLSPSDLSLSAAGLVSGTVLQGQVVQAVPTIVSDPSDSNNNNYKMPDSITVRVLPKDNEEGDDDEYQEAVDFTVDVEKFSGKKPYYGGFRNKKTSLVYHHADTQTAEKSKKKTITVKKFHRDSQTAVQSTCSAQTTREFGTQMSIKGKLEINEDLDRVVQPKRYVDSAQHHYIKNSSVLVIQCHWRGYAARLRASRVRQRRIDREKEKVAQEARDKAHADAVQAREIQRRMNPKTFEDFEILYNELENWRQYETTNIRQLQMPREEKTLANTAMLEKETKLLQTIDRLKASASTENRKARIAKMMEMMSRPKKWQMSDGEVREVHTTHTTRAAELKELYTGLTTPLMSTDERLDVLLHVKWTVKEFECDLTKEVVELIDREADMLNRGRKAKSLQGLRRRISNLFLQFIETPEFNPEAKHFKLVPK